MTPFDPAIGVLIDGRLPELGPGSPNEAVRAALQSVEAPAACRAGLWLLHDFLDESHTISQDDHSVEGSFWHAIMHRREPDPSNAKYWFRRVGDHPVVEELRRQAPALGYRYTSPFDFVDFCESVRGTGHANEMLARRIQRLEWQLLFDACRSQARN